jgi:hypothetical protein
MSISCQKIPVNFRHENNLLIHSCHADPAGEATDYLDFILTRMSG